MTFDAIERNTNFSDIKEVLFNFISSCKQLLHKGESLNLAYDDQVLQDKALEIIHFYTTKKFHKYHNYIFDFDKIKHIKEIQ